MGESGDGGGGGHNDYLHAVATLPSTAEHIATDDDTSHRIVLTGGEDGVVIIWDAVRRSVIRAFDCQKILTTMTNTTTKGGSIEAVATFHNKDYCWVSSVEIDPPGRRAIIGGGVHRHHPTSVDVGGGGGVMEQRRRSDRGFLLFLYLPTLSNESVATARDNVAAAAYCEGRSSVVSVGNEGVVSCRSRTDLGMVLGRAWVSCPSAYCCSVRRDEKGDVGDADCGSDWDFVGSGLVAIGGVGRVIDCVAGTVTKFRLTF